MLVFISRDFTESFLSAYKRFKETREDTPFPVQLRYVEALLALLQSYYVGLCKGVEAAELSTKMTYLILLWVKRHREMRIALFLFVCAIKFA